MATNTDAKNETNTETNTESPADKKSGRVLIVSFDLDTTGCRIVDEIVQLAAYAPEGRYQQYIMPYMNLNPAARNRHQVRVISVGYYRMLKSTKTLRIIKSKSEYHVLNEFLTWLEGLKSKIEDVTGIVLMYHDPRKFVPCMLLESLKKYNLLDRFLLTVKAFVNGFEVAKSLSKKPLDDYNLRSLSKTLKCRHINLDDAAANDANGTTDKTRILRGRDLFDGNARARARFAYAVALVLSNQDSKEPIKSIEARNRMSTNLLPFIRPVEFEMKELQVQNENLQKQTSFRPVFLNHFKTIYHRVRAVKFRIILAQHGHSLESLQNVWKEKQKAGLNDVLNDIKELESSDKEELVELFDSYFDPEKEMVKPDPKRRRDSSRASAKSSDEDREIKSPKSPLQNDSSNSQTSTVKEEGAGGDKQSSGTSVKKVDSTEKVTKRNDEQQREKSLPRSRYQSRPPNHRRSHRDHVHYHRSAERNYNGRRSQQQHTGRRPQQDGRRQQPDSRRQQQDGGRQQQDGGRQQQDGDRPQQVTANDQRQQPDMLNNRHLPQSIFLGSLPQQDIMNGHHAGPAVIAAKN